MTPGTPQDSRARFDAKPDLDDLARQPWPLPGRVKDLADDLGVDAEPHWADRDDSGGLDVFIGIRNAVVLTLAGVGAGFLIASLWVAVHP